MDVEMYQATPASSLGALCGVPEEVAVRILQHSDADSLAAFSQTCDDGRRLASEKCLWRKLCKSHGWNVPRSQNTTFDYKRYYFEKLSLSRPGSLKWVESPKYNGDVPSKRFKHSATVVGKQIVYIGGQETDDKRFNEIYHFDSETRTFMRPNVHGDQVPNFSRHSATLVGKTIIVFGGFDGKNKNFELAMYDTETFEWRNVETSMVKGLAPKSRTNHAAASVGNKMYIFGGNNTSDTGNYQVLGDFHMFDTETLTWSQPEPLGEVPTARSGHCMVSIGTKLYLFGGGVWSQELSWVHKYNDLHVYDTETGVWTKPVTKGEVQTSTFAIPFTVGRFLFLFGGGSKPHFVVTNNVYILDTTTMEWTEATMLNGAQPLPRDMGTASVVGGNVYFVGGYAGGAVAYFDQLAIASKALTTA